MNSYDKINKIYEETVLSELTKQKVFAALNTALSGQGDWMTIDDIAKKIPAFPMSKHGLEAHLRELVGNKKAKESIKKGKAIYKLD
jgi:hypothetical protein